MHAALRPPGRVPVRITRSAAARRVAAALRERAVSTPFNSSAGQMFVFVTALIAVLI